MRYTTEAEGSIFEVHPPENGQPGLYLRLSLGDRTRYDQVAWGVTPSHYPWWVAEEETAET